MKNKRIIKIPDKIESLILSFLKSEAPRHSHGEINWSQLAKAILALSDSFKNEGNSTAWANAYAVPAYLAYFFPLNAARLQSIIYEIDLLGLKINETVIDFGSGLGLSQICWTKEYSDWINIESSQVAVDIHKKLLKQFQASALVKSTWPANYPGDASGKTVIASYSLNEIGELPPWMESAETLIILEPSTSQVARKLMTTRKMLLEKGFYAIAPCVHQEGCPLLENSKRDWCHDRFHFTPPSWWQSLSPHLPMRNDTLTMSYLVLSKQKIQHPQNTARVIGDTLFEKGKTRQAVCRGPQREFLSWLKKTKEHQEIPHGSRIILPETLEIKANEIRLSSNIKII